VHFPLHQTSGEAAQRDERMTGGERLADTLAHLAARWTYLVSYLAIRQAEQRLVDRMPWLRPGASDTEAKHETGKTPEAPAGNTPGSFNRGLVFILGGIAALGILIRMKGAGEPFILHRAASGGASASAE
jgi:hypothetical protein